MNPNSHEPLTIEQMRKLDAIYDAHYGKEESQTPPPLSTVDYTCVPEREENLSGQLERHRDTLQEKPKLEKCNAYIIIAGTKCGIEAYTKESVEKCLRHIQAELFRVERFIDDETNSEFVPLTDLKRYVEERLK